MSTDFVRDPVAEEARRHRLDTVTKTYGCMCGFTRDVPAIERTTPPEALSAHLENVARAGAAGKHEPIPYPLFWTHACACAEAMTSTSLVGSYDLFEEHLDAIEHGELS